MKTERMLHALVMVGLIGGVVLTQGCSSDKSTNPTGGGPNPTFNSGDMSTPGQVFAFTFPDAGNFDYRCIHHAGMTGTVNVMVSSANDSMTVQVGLGGNNFNPSSVTVKPGGSVRWIYAGTGTPHTVTRP